MSFEFAATTLQELTSGPLGPWITFAVKTAPNAAVLAFTFVLLLAILFTAGRARKRKGMGKGDL